MHDDSDEAATSATTATTTTSTTTTTGESDASKPAAVAMGQVAVGHVYPIGNARELTPMTLDRLNSIIDDAIRADAARVVPGAR